MNRLSNPPLRSGIWQAMLVMLITSWSPSSNAITIDTISTDNFLLLDNTLLLNAGVASTSSSFSVRSDFGRGRIRALGLRSEFGREMIRMGREFNNYLRGRATARSYSRLFLRDAGTTLSLRSGARTNLSALSVRKSRQLLTGRYILGARSRSTSLYANYAITDKNLIWTVTDKSSNQVFALSNYKSVPEPGALLLFMSGLIGLAVVMFYRPRAQQQSVS